jgi:arsenite methyltransferase
MSKESWKDHYAKIAAYKDLPRNAPYQQALSKGYSEEELDSVPDGTVLGLGCGNPTALAELRAGETCLDLGCGVGLDALLASRRVGKKGMVIGVDVTLEMIERARDNAKKGDYGNVEFMVGDMVNLPVVDQSVDVVISNCVISHVADKLAVFKELLRILKPNGRMHIADLTFEGVLTDEMRNKIDEIWTVWIAGASSKKDYMKAIEDAGFKDVRIVVESLFGMDERDDTLKEEIHSLQARAYKQ